MDDLYCILELFIILVLSGKRYFHQIEMISVIKMEKGRWAAVGVCWCYYFAFVHFFNLIRKIW